MSFVGPMMTMLVLNSKSRALPFGGIKYIQKISLTIIDPRFVRNMVQFVMMVFVADGYAHYL